mgnify:CR=1 FL=1
MSVLLPHMKKVTKYQLNNTYSTIAETCNAFRHESQRI